MDSIRVSEAPDPGSIPGEATIKLKVQSSKLKVVKTAAMLYTIIKNNLISVSEAPDPGSLPGPVRRGFQARPLIV